jgi:hypothetical protein
MSKMSNKKETVADLIKPKKKYLYPCHCIRCNGAEVDARTQEKHTLENLWKSGDAKRIQERAIASRKRNKSSINTNASFAKNPIENLPSKK